MIKDLAREVSVQEKGQLKFEIDLIHNGQVYQQIQLRT